MLDKYQKALVTGGCGFIGSHLTEALLSLGKEVSVFDNCSSGTEENLAPGAHLSKGDLRAPEEIAEAVKGAEVVFHLAANASGTRSIIDPLYDFEVNTRGTINLLAAAVEAKVKKVVYVSSAAVYGVPQAFPMAEDHPTEPFLPYGGSKLTSEVLCRTFSRVYELPVVIARPMAVYGPRENPESALVEIGRYLRWHLNGGPIKIVGDPDRKTRDFVHVSDMIRGLILLADRGSLGEAYNVASGGEVSMRQLADIIGSATDRPARIDVKQDIQEDTYRLVADISKIRSLGYDPQMSLEKGVKQLAEYLGENPTLPGGETIFNLGQQGGSW